MIEAAVLTGGRSRRMGRDKAALPIGGEGQAVR
ncbi:molybdenum cofactor guanylyltransferase, partial [bacterium]